MADRHQANMLQMLFHYSRHYECSGTFASAREAFRQPLNTMPDLVVTSQLEIPSIRYLKEQFLHVPVLVLVEEKTDEVIIHAMSGGASNCIFRGSSPTAYLQACDDILTGTIRINGSVSQKMFDKNPDTGSSLTGILTSREQDLLQQLKMGLQYKEIAAKFSISIETVKRHCSNIYRKLEVSNRTEAVNKFQQRK